MSEALSEYENQLSEVNEMLEADPNDDSLIQLKQDLLVLIAETKKEEENDSPLKQSETSSDPLPTTTNSDIIDQEPEKAKSTEESAKLPEPNTSNTAADNTSTVAGAPFKKTKKSKKTKIPTNFEVPTHLVPLDSDTEAERNRKRRAIKTLKSKWKERVKESRTTQKQKSWQDFVGKGQRKRKNGGKGSAWKGVANVGGSIFKTEDGVNARVGVIGSGKSMTEFGERKRFKM